jgi:hypothetical protein
VSEVDPDPNEPSGGEDRSVLGGRAEPGGGDPTAGGRRGQIGEAPSVAADEADVGPSLAPGGGHVAEEPDAAPVADPGPEA